MQTKQTRPRKVIKDAIRSIQTDTSKAGESDVLHAAEVNTACTPTEVKDAYEDLRKHGEIYSYPSGGVVVVRITDEVLQ